MTKLKARAVKNRLNKYNVVVSIDCRNLPLGETSDLENYRILEWDTKEEATQRILDDDRLELVK